MEIEQTIDPETGVVESQTTKATKAAKAAVAPTPKAPAEPSEKPAPSRRKKVDADGEIAKVVPLRAAEEKQKASAKLELCGDNAKLLSFSVTKLVRPPDDKTPEFAEVGLVLDIPISSADKYPLHDLVRQITQRSESEDEGHRTTKVNIKRTYGSATIIANDLLQKSSVKFLAEIKGAPVVSVVDGIATMRVGLNGRIPVTELRSIILMLNQEREWIVAPTQGELF